MSGADLPDIDTNKLAVWNQECQKCCGFLGKKGGTNGSAFSRRNWQQRWFVLEHNIERRSNYTLAYFGKQGDSKPKGVLTLEGAKILMEDKHRKKKISNEFQIRVVGSEADFDVSAASEAERDAWMRTLKYAISVANERGEELRKLQRGRRDGANPNPNPNPVRSRRGSAGTAMARAFAPAMTPFEARRPRLRLEYDLQNAPPGSQERSRLITGFREDLKQALHLEDGVDVSVHSVIPAAEADWQTIVEFSFVGAEGIHEECCKEIDVKLRDPNSGLLSGLVTCKLDVSFFECGMKPRTMRSAEPRVQAVLDKYTNMQIPAGVLDLSRFKITLEFEGTVKPLLVPNPRVLRRRACYIWPYEVKEALGVLGTVLDTWMEPIALVPQQLEDFLASPVPFRPSASHEGLKVIDARLLKAGAHYVVEFEDRRSELLDLLADEEHDLIVEKFRAFDTNNNGAISRDEAQAYARARSDEGREKIDAQYEAFIAQAGNNSEEAIKEAEAQRDAHYSKIMEAEAKLLDMLARADTDGDGTLRLEEFAMAEAWWMRSTLNASRVELF